MFISLIYNAALLLVLVFLYDLVARFLRHQTLLFKLLTGLLLGVIAVAVMIASVRLPDGVIFDTRSVVLSVGTLFYGTVPGMIAGAISAVYRIGLGGPGAVMGVSVIAMSVIVGALWRRWRRTAKRDPSILELYLFGLTVHVLMLALTSTLPDPLTTLRSIAAPVIVIYPLAAVLLGLLMIDERRRRRSEAALRESEERNRTIMATLPGGLVHIIDRDLRYVFTAGEGMAAVGLTNEMLAGKRIDEVLDADTAATVETNYRRVLEGETVRFEGVFNEHAFLVTSAPLRGLDGEIAHILTLSVDITDRRHAEDEVRRLNADLARRIDERTAQLRHANEELESFAYSVAHDLRAPLRAVDGFATLIEEEGAAVLNEECRGYLVRVRAAVGKMGTLIDGLLRLSRLSRSQAKMTTVDLSALAVEAAADLARLDPGRRVEVRVEPGLVASGDRELLRAALDNLLGNAWKFTRETPDARIEVGRDLRDGQAVYYVRDNGVGFDQQYVDKLFRPFERLHLESEYEGTGIGLASVARIVARHRGRVWAEGTDHGATFSFTLGTEVPSADA